MSKRNRFGVGTAVAVVIAAGVGGAVSTRAQDITEFRNGYITFTNQNPSLYYRVEFKPNLSDPVNWDGRFRDLRNIHSPDAEVTVPVGVFYRVVGRDTPWVAGTALAPDILAGKTAYVNDEEVTGTMANVGQQNITPSPAAQTITQGYHDGTGSVAGDADLAAGNIRKDVAIFGVTGTFEDSAVPKTGQTTKYLTEDDGDLEKGVVWPNPRFTDNGDGTVTDNMTGLIWVRSPGLLAGSKTNWNDAANFCNNLTFAGQTDWRLPNVRELLSLIDFGHNWPALPSGHPFTATDLNGSLQWTSTTYDRNPLYAWVVISSNGVVDTRLKRTFFSPFCASS